ncbi:MAG: aminotransferase class V-fold PLP-dependent enzyme [Acidobacteria bacterium ACB1]|nr:L-allo-threonine aldolase [Pyrinomonadaceae bacterium]MCE7961935.1 aminotransferase class V-fold PLP-dependent enzyme [Acidobacteria bacterium ACB1]RIJ94417.1 MAG: low specificity L-threonine aldolase [Acidobacteriota bacterium]
MIDLRSDTVTRPSEEMRAAMAAAEVGDDVFGEDPTINRLQALAAERMGFEAALWVPSGSMGNTIAVKLHTEPGSEIIIEERGHILNFELGAAAVISGVVARSVKSSNGTGHLTWDDVGPAIRKNPPYYQSATKLLCLENTHNFAGGSVLGVAATRDLCENAHSEGLKVHLDGARIFNAATALKCDVKDLVAGCDSVTFCLSKGLGAPAGSMLVGTSEFIEEARSWRKRLGGGMRQVGILAAAGIIALEKGPGLLERDHRNAKRLANGLAAIPGIKIDPESVVTNIVIFDSAGAKLPVAEIVEKLRDRGVLAIGFGSQIRMVTHLDIADTDIDVALLAMTQIVG